MSKKDKKEQQDNHKSAEELTDQQLQEEVDTAEAEGQDSDSEAQIEQELAELKDKYLRLFAEFDNYKKRTMREKLELMNNAAQDTLSALLPVLDDFDRARQIAEDEQTEETFSEGVTLVYQKLYNTLRQLGLQVMDTNGEAFDPELHEAITKIPAPSPEEKGKIIDTIQKGYKLKDRIIRHAKVVVGE